MTILLFLLILAALVFFHELGHFLAAKIFGIRVDEFAIGFPPRLFSYKHGETEYSINLIPFGGYVKIFGENPDENEVSNDKRSFQNVSKLKQATVLFAGIFMNIIFGWLMISSAYNIGLLTYLDNPQQNNATNISVAILSVMKDSPAEKGGLKEGDQIESITSNKTKTEIKDISQVQSIVTENSKINIEYKRENTTGSVEILVSNNLLDGKKGIGIGMGYVGIVRYSFPSSLYEGAKLTAYEIKDITVGIYEFLKSAIKGQGNFSEVSGPVGIVSLVGKAKAMGIAYLFAFISIISLNLAVLNFIPFPALDGGRILFVVIEAVIRRKINPKILNWVNGIGFGLLIVLMIVITYKDIAKLIH